jgi:bifunctional UDP-N-acetylglucosamine pyrophosphorylase/glucosamine-1-phosphate N-acetyltransferase
MDRKIAAVILAAGDGKRMKSNLPKVCQNVLFKPMRSWVLAACRNLGLAPADTCVVLSANANAAAELVSSAVTTAIQTERRGTGHAVRTALSFLQAAKARGVEDVAVLCGDAPLIDAVTLEGALSLHRKDGFFATVISAHLPEPGRYGRIVRRGGAFSRIVEAADATAKEMEICEICTGAYWFSLDFLLTALPLLTDHNAQGEFYLTDLLGIAFAQGGAAGAYPVPDPDVALGANDREGLALLNRVARGRVLKKLRAQGVDIPIDDGVVISPDARVGMDTVILPGTILRGNVVVGEGCTIGPNTTIIDCEIGDFCTIDSSRLERSRIGSHVRVGPFAQIRPDCDIADRVKIGNFVEVKNSTLGEKTSLAHLTYVGDSDFGADINVGCGVVTVNYDGRGKYRTVVEDGAFIGCNTNLIAPVRVGAGAYVAAATTVNTNVSPGALAIGRVPQQQKEGWPSAFWPKKDLWDQDGFSVLMIRIHQKAKGENVS